MGPQRLLFYQISDAAASKHQLHKSHGILSSMIWFSSLPSLKLTFKTESLSLVMHPHYVSCMFWVLLDFAQWGLIVIL